MPKVRFLDQGLVHEILRRAIVDALGRTGAPELVIERAAPAALAATGTAPFALDMPAGLTAAGMTRALPLGFAAPAAAPPAAWADARVGTQAGRQDVAGLIRPMTPLGQFRNTFIIAVDDEGLVIVDQHALLGPLDVGEDRGGDRRRVRLRGRAEPDLSLVVDGGLIAV